MTKRQAFLELLELGRTMLHLDARRDGVDVPPQFRNDPHLRLDYSYRFYLDVFEIDEQEVRASLSFQGETYLCVVPWNAVFAMTSHVTGRTLVWLEDVPVELAPILAALPNVGDAGPVEVWPAEEASDAGDGEGEARFSEPDLEEEADAIGGAVRRVGHLRVIK